MHDIVARNAIEQFLKSTKLWRCFDCRKSRLLQGEMRWNFFEVGQALEMLRVTLATILAREMRLKKRLNF